MASGLYDLDGSQNKVQMIRQIVNLSLEIDTLRELLDKHGIISSLEFDAAKNYLMSTSKYKDMFDYLKNAEATIQRYKNDPEAHLRELFNQKLHGKG